MQPIGAITATNETAQWWGNDPRECAWLETTDRAQLGVDLAAPQRSDNGRELHGSTLITLPHKGDVIFHYQEAAQAIVAYSIATGVVWDEEIVWAAQGTVAREADLQPRTRPGWRHGLIGPYPLTPSVSLEDLRSHDAEIADARTSLAQQHLGRPLYFPFALSEKRPLRPTKSYLSKFPVALAALFPELRLALEAVAQGEARDRGAIPVGDTFGTAYVPVEVGPNAQQRDPFILDPSVLDRATASHFSIQNALAEWLVEENYEPLSPRADDPKFDLAWRMNNYIFVAEVKILSETSEEQQLRLGLGQVFRYHHLLARRFGHNRVIAVLVVERAPKDLSWLDLCSVVGVVLVWPGVFARIRGVAHPPPSA